MRKEYDFSKAKPAQEVPAIARHQATSTNKERITIRLDTDVLNWFRAQADQAGGGSYQTLINRALQTYIQDQREPLEATLRRVLREELEQVQS